MRVLITAGGTSEKIDDVRSITNHSSGRLGCLIAEEFLKNHATVDFVTTAQAKHPAENKKLQLYEIEGTQGLADQLQELLQKTTYDAVIHSMAVSDFTPAQTFSQEDFLASINHLFQEKKGPLTKEDLTQLTDRTEADEKKISSDTEQLYLVLKKTPKVIQLIKKIQPETLLVGFKLLVDVSKQTLITTAQAGIGKNQADYILANDLAKIKDNQHIGYLIDKNGQIIGEKQTKESIAQLIFQTIDRHNT
ncbi:phosphopantothenate--cysteine ligase [Tetragenococcus koreensis]|uniref:phosphopantothenate--cysteine ligase n=1 Tax=Tetragenococcus koreensis TaxID=290335 RepID=UPI000F505347|nr:phosphopantothenate--cysteine ligase [Tetragenococcus koreensis]AYW45448.1 phosphopantothenate--cysteine ligase [Tetragenococcus koreensis]MCF1630771.1 phosphopantothenate--cysteine ligase [Tetragenococcus koreensis]MDN6471158.1 phosphopantothenate--cysteine ligase [Tetragenococcus koreensis]MDN6663541.1 phosphopantothenate--cysteine ligase [Tetragenococcus koreensis]GEN90521.1 phosphopantothenate--cysteine ligase [Tetragenococcus koreensis]